MTRDGATTVTGGEGQVALQEVLHHWDRVREVPLQQKGVLHHQR
jgi:hypothetical protein